MNMNTLIHTHTRTHTHTHTRHVRILNSFKYAHGGVSSITFQVRGVPMENDNKILVGVKRDPEVEIEDRSLIREEIKSL